MPTAMHCFIRRENIKHYRKLLRTATSEEDRQRVLKLLSEEEQKQRDAGDQPDGTQLNRGRLDDLNEGQDCTNSGNRDRDRACIQVQGEPLPLS